jgi:hypothetical protein
MRCQDVRRALPLLVAGEMPLTEWALLETHLVECVECRGELDRQRVQAAQRARIRRRSSTAAALVATAVVLVVAGAGFYIYETSLPDPYRPGTVRMPPRPSAPPMTVTPVAPLPVPVTSPAAPVARPIPPAPPAPVPPPAPVQATPTTRTVDTAIPPPARIPAAASESVPRPVRVPPAVPPAEERMPTQARPPAAATAGPGAEAMPTQGASRPAR